MLISFVTKTARKLERLGMVGTLAHGIAGAKIV